MTTPDAMTVMYHATDARNRDSIARRGLLIAFYFLWNDDPQPDDIVGIFMTRTEPEPDWDHQDFWVIDTSKLTHLELDHPIQQEEFGGSYWTKNDVPPEAMWLHHRGTSTEASPCWIRAMQEGVRLGLHSAADFGLTQFH